jgi:hypothetical protein
MDGTFQGITLKEIHARRLREIYRSAGWPCLDVVEIELLAAGVLARVTDPSGHERVHVTDSGIRYLAGAAQNNRQAYLELGGQCWYVLGRDAKDRPIAEPDEMPAECGVMQVVDDAVEVLRVAPKRQFTQLPFGIWMALAKAAPLRGSDAADSMGLLPSATD